MSSAALLVTALAVMTVAAIAVVVLPLVLPARSREAAAGDAEREAAHDTGGSAEAGGPAGAGGTAVAGTTSEGAVQWARRAPLTALAAALLLPAASALVYLQLSTFDWNTLTPRGAAAAGGEAGGAQAIIGQLARRLAEEGGTVEEWRLLGRSLLQAGQPGRAEGAFREAYRQVAGGESELVAAVGAEYAEAMIFNDQRALLSDAGTLLEQSLAADPANPRALWWGGLAAFERGEYELSVARWQRLLANPQMNDETMRSVVRERVTLAETLAATGAPPPAELRARMEAEGAGQAVARAPGAQAAPGAGGPAGGGPAMDGADAALPVSLRVAVVASPEFDDTAEEGYPLFVIARRPGAGGPPLAVVRRVSSELPFEVELSDEDAMIPGRGISSVDEVEVVARISLSGNPVAASGDLWGSERVRVEQDAMVEITISERTP